MCAILPPEYFKGLSAYDLAQQLIGKKLITTIDGKYCEAMITETEAYSQEEKGCHAYGGKRTERTEIMFGEGGYSYVYLCYGIHHLFNIVCGNAGVAEAVLIRAVQPVRGLHHMMERRKKNKVDQKLSSGPAMLTQALGIQTRHTAVELRPTNHIWLENYIQFEAEQIQHATRIGIDYAGEDAKRLWRFFLKDNYWISKKL